jgi:diaminopimelate epimerase
MKTFNFYKYQGAGNDFIIFDCINEEDPRLTTPQIELLCDRRFGIGADGLMYILPHDEHDFRMQYFNSDGNESTMCGNGGRCIAHLAHHLHISSPLVKFVAVDGYHEAAVSGDSVALGMIDVRSVDINEDGDYILNTGSPHYIHFTNKSALTDIVKYGQQIRYSDIYKDKGINVNMAAPIDDALHVATYERGVEDETLACGTGVTAVALAYSLKENAASPIKIKAKGGDMKIHFTKNEDGTFTQVVLEGPAVMVYQGSIKL